MKIASHVLYFNQDRWILDHIEMVAPFVEKIYVAWSELPWTYNPAARANFKNNSDPEFLKQSPYFDKIELIEGTWNLDEEQRNSCLEAAEKDGMDVLLIIDADEFYTKEALGNIIEEIKNNREPDTYFTQFFTYWKDYDHVLAKGDGSVSYGHLQVAMNLNRGHRFVRCRRPSGNKTVELQHMCGHASYVLSDEECWSKINIWGHAHQFNLESWFDDKWKNWNENTLNLHPIEPSAWYKAIPIPEELDLAEVLR